MILDSGFWFQEDSAGLKIQDSRFRTQDTTGFEIHDSRGFKKEQCPWDIVSECNAGSAS
jgi:hypothetical protein